MDVSSFVLLSQAQALKRRLDVVANNMANLSTTGFKRERPVFREYVERASEATPDAARPTSFVLDQGAMHDTAAGAFQSTGSTMDVMIDGPGYLAVEAPGGETAYTRAGFVRIDEQGRLTTAGGQVLLGEGGRAIQVSADQQEGLAIGSDGTVSGKAGVVGRLAVTVFEDETGVVPRGDGMMTASGGRELAAADTRLRTGGVEASNVDPIVETTQMVEILRAYQTSARIAQDMDDMRRRAIERLGKLG